MTLRLLTSTALALTALALSAGVALAAPADLDSSFGRGGVATIDAGAIEAPSDVAVQPDGKIVVAGQTAAGDILVSRLDANGARDPSFDGDGVRTFDAGGTDVATAVAVQPDGRIVVAGYTTAGENGFVHRVNADGSPDLSFNGTGARIVDSGGDDAIHALALQPDGGILVAGETAASPFAGDGIVHRLRPDGTFDPTFGSGGARRVHAGNTTSIEAMALQPDGRIVVAGRTQVVAIVDGFVARLRTDGTDDATFNGGLRLVDNGGSDSIDALALQPDGRIAAAVHTSIDLDARTAVFRFTAAGALDGSVVVDDRGGTFIENMAAQADGKLLLGGRVRDGQDGVVFRLLPDGARDAGFDGDGELRIASFDGVFGLAVQPDGKILLAGFNGQDALVVRLLGDSAVPAPPPEGGAPEPPAPPTAGAPPAQAAADTRAPTIARLAFKRPRIRFVLSEPAAVSITLHRCVRRARRCTRYRLVRTIARRGLPAGLSAIAMPRLRPARYRVTVTATDAAGNRSAPARIRFTAARRPR